MSYAFIERPLVAKLQRYCVFNILRAGVLFLQKFQNVGVLQDAGVPLFDFLTTHVDLRSTNDNSEKAGDESKRASCRCHAHDVF